VKASDVDRGASLRALETRLGPYEERRPLLEEVGRDLRTEVRERELADELAPLHYARQEHSFAATGRDEAARRLDTAGGAVHRAAERVYRDPYEAASRYLAHLRGGGAAEVQPAELGPLQGAVIRLGRHYLPLGREAKSAYQLATEKLPPLGVAYVQAWADLARADARLAAARQQVEQLEQHHRPQLEELNHLAPAAQRRDLAERVMSLRPRDQIALAREYGPEILHRAAERAPQGAGQTAAWRERWLQNLAPQLVRALDRQLSRHRIPPPTPAQSPANWMANAVRRGLRPAHGAQALARSGVSLAHTVQATSRALSLTQTVVGDPAKAAALIAAKALGVPALPVRLAVIAWSLTRRLGRTLSR
jgi:hypothetical protein